MRCICPVITVTGMWPAGDGGRVWQVDVMRCITQSVLARACGQQDTGTGYDKFTF